MAIRERVRFSRALIELLPGLKLIALVGRLPSLHMRLRPETRGIVGREDLAWMKPNELRAGRPGFAAVDICEEEPVTGDNHPLPAMPNVLCTPHLGWAEWDYFGLHYRECFEQILAYAQGKPMRPVAAR